MFFSRLFAAALPLAAATLAPIASASPIQVRDIVDDVFIFTPPPGFENQPNGAILRSKKVNVFFTNTNYTVDLDSAYQILYKTTNPIDFSATVTPLTILIPKGNTAVTQYDASNPQPNNILFEFVPYDAVNVICGPSRTIALNPFIYAKAGAEDWYAKALSQGLTVVLPDYENQEALFAVGPLEGRSSLDAIRATLAFAPAVPSKEHAQVVLEGYSGGAIAAGWAMQLVSSYAPELATYIKGATIGGLAANITETVIALKNANQPAVVIAGFASFYKGYPSIRSYLDKHLNVQGRAIITAIQLICPVQLSTFLAGITDLLAELGLGGKADSIPTAQPPDVTRVSFFENFTDVTTEQALAAPEVRIVLDSLTLADPQAIGGMNLPTAPVYIYSGTADDLLPHSDTVNYYQRLCDHGVASATLIESNGTNHATTAERLTPNQARDFLLDRLAGKPAPQGCTRSLI